MKLTDLLDQIDRLDQQATKGPWEVVDEEYDDQIIANVTRSGLLETTERIVHADDAAPADREFIALARTALPQFAKALRAVMELHKTRVHDEDPTSPFCNICGPVIGQSCETLQAITDALGGDDA